MIKIKKPFLLFPCLPRRSVNEGGSFPRRRESHRPIAALFILALLVLAPTAAKADCTSPAGVASQTLYDSSTNQLKFCNGTDWIFLVSWLNTSIEMPFSKGIGSKLDDPASIHALYPYLQNITTDYTGGLTPTYSVGMVVKADAQIVFIETDADEIVAYFNLNSATFTWNGDAYMTGGGAWTASSDSRLKDIDGPYTSGLDEVALLSPVRYHYKKDNIRGEPSDKQYIGLVAQQAMQSMPELVSVRASDGYYDLDPSDLRFALINAFKQLKAENDALEKRLEALEQEAAQ